MYIVSVTWAFVWHLIVIICTISNFDKRFLDKFLLLFFFLSCYAKYTWYVFYRILEIQIINDFCHFFSFSLFFLNSKCNWSKWENNGFNFCSVCGTKIYYWYSKVNIKFVEFFIILQISISSWCQLLNLIVIKLIIWK